MTLPVYPPGLRFDSTGAGGWVCPVGAPMAKKHPPGGEGLSHSPADGGNHPSKATCLSSVVNSWQQGPFSPTVTSNGQKTGCTNRGLHAWTTGESTPSAALGGWDCGIFLEGLQVGSGIPEALNHFLEGRISRNSCRSRTNVTADEKMSENAGVELTHPMAGASFTKSLWRCPTDFADGGCRRPAIPSVCYWPATWLSGVVVVAVLRCGAQQLMRAEEACLPFLTEPVALAPDVQHVAVVQQPVQHGRGDDRVAQ